MYLLALLAIVLSTGFMAGTTITAFGMGDLASYLDVRSIFFLVIIVIPMLAASGLIKSFNQSFRLAFGREKARNLLELKKAREAVALVQKTLIYGGLFSSLFYAVILLKVIESIQEVGDNLSVALTNLVYATVLNLALVPVRAKLEIKIAEYMQD